MKQTAGWKQFGIADIFRRGKTAWAGAFGGWGGAVGWGHKGIKYVH